MIFFLNLKKRVFILAFLPLIIYLVIGLSFYEMSSVAVTTSTVKEEFKNTIQHIFDQRNQAILDNSKEILKSFYNTSSKYGTWAYEHQERKMQYLHNWAEKQSIVFTNIASYIEIRSLKHWSEGYKSYMMVSTTYTYNYTDEPESINSFRIGTYHSVNLLDKNDRWVINKEWYTDPFADSLNLDDIKKEEFKSIILKSSPRDFSDLNPRRISAVDYADLYCGAAGTKELGFSYNNKYRDYNPIGGDCANFASQVLYEGGGFRKTSSWNYGRDGSKAWLNAQAFKSHLLYSGRASLIASGTYEKVFKPSFKLLPGDIVAYEKKGKVKHVSVVTGADSKGYVLVNCHNTDRYRVPWDLGWSNKNIRFWLIRVHY